MKVMEKMMNEANKIMEERFYDFEKFGIRVQSKEFPAVGEIIDHCSKVWNEGEETDEELPGLSVCEAQYVNRNDAHHYFGNHIALVGFNKYSYGEDPYELIAEEPEVLLVLA